MQLIPQAEADLMTRAQKAVRVAQDVIVQVETKQLQLSRGEYVSVRERVAQDLYDACSSKDLSELLALITPDCRVCQLGACLLSQARLFNNIPADCLVTHGGGCGIGADTVYTELGALFSRQTLSLLEIAFERSRSFCHRNCSEDLARGAMAFSWKYQTKDEVVVAAMTNIIANEGEFVVEPVSDMEYWQRYANNPYALDYPVRA